MKDDSSSRSAPQQQNAPSSETTYRLRDHATLSDQVRRALERYIKEHNLTAGDQLPTEGELCTMFGVSRTAVREAMKALAALGVVSIEPGRGTFLRSFDIGRMLATLPISLAFGDHDAVEIIELRRYLERFCVERSTRVARRNPSHPLLDELTKCVERMKVLADRGEDIRDEDIRFHRLLALLAENRLLLMILEVFWRLREALPSDDRPEAIVARYERHRTLLAALLRGNEKEAVAQNEFHYSVMIREIGRETPARETARG